MDIKVSGDDVFRMYEALRLCRTVADVLSKSEEPYENDIEASE